MQRVLFHQKYLLFMCEYSALFMTIPQFICVKLRYYRVKPTSSTFLISPFYKRYSDVNGYNAPVCCFKIVIGFIVEIIIVQIKRYNTCMFSLIRVKLFLSKKSLFRKWKDTYRMERDRTRLILVYNLIQSTLLDIASII